jgi:hypothetical protein
LQFAVASMLLCECWPFKGLHNPPRLSAGEAVGGLMVCKQLALASGDVSHTAAVPAGALANQSVQGARA